ncbi:hypothetical protein JW948_16675 [bacterium]|nr:hypothetical protein [bacterium]
MRLGLVLLIAFVPLMAGDDSRMVFRTEQDVSLHMAMMYPSGPDGDSRAGSGIAGKKPGLGLIMSAAVPGSGEFYAGSWIKGLVFAGIETAMWIGYSHYRAEGDRKDDAFRAFADAHWSETRYWVHMAGEASQVFGYENLSAVNESNYEQYLEGEYGLRAYEQAHFSHGLHVIKDQQYYEMIGKYHQFRAGWEDAETSNEVVTPLRGIYEDMEYETDSEYKKAGTCAMVILANHVVSAMDAVWSVKQANRRIQVRPGMGVIPSRGRLEPAFAVNIEW